MSNGLSMPFLMIDALGTEGCGVVCTSKASEASLAIPACIFVGVVNAVGSGLIRDVLVREEPLLFKPGQFYVTALYLGVAEFMLVYYLRPRTDRARRHLSDGNRVCL